MLEKCEKNLAKKFLANTAPKALKTGYLTKE